MLRKALDKWKGTPVEVKASVSYTLCNILQKCLSLITLPLFTRLLTQQQYGQYSVYISWVSIMSIFTTLNLAYGSFSTAMVKFDHDRRGYLSSIQNLCLLLSLLFLMIYLPFSDLWNKLFELPTPLVCLMVAEVLATFSLTCWYGLKRFEYKYISIIAVTLSIAVLSPAMAYLMVISSHEKGYARIFGYALVTIAFGGFLFVSNAIRGKNGFRKEYWKYALSFNIPLIPYYLSQVIFNQSDRIMISHYSGTDKAGMYGVAYTLATILTFVLNAINNSYVPWFYRKIKAGQTKDNRNISTGIALLMAFLLLGIIALAPEIIGILAGKAYVEAAWVVPPVAISILLLFYSQLFINVEFYYEKKTLLVWGSIGSAVLNIVLNALLIPHFGFVAAGYTTLVSYIGFAVANYFALKHFLEKDSLSLDHFDLKALIGIFLGMCLLTVAAVSLYELPVIRYAIIAIVLLTLVVLYKPVIKFLKNVLIRK